MLSIIITCRSTVVVISVNGDKINVVGLVLVAVVAEAVILKDVNCSSWYAGG